MVAKYIIMWWKIREQYLPSFLTLKNILQVICEKLIFFKSLMINYGGRDRPELKHFQYV